jgi:ribosome-associated protein
MGERLSISSSLAIPVAELRFRFSRSGGAGGQHVNKVSTRVELLFNIRSSSSLTDQQKERLLSRLKTRVDAEGCLAVSSQESRSQWQNREQAVKKFITLISRALRETRPRLATKVTKGSRERRLRTKSLESRKKERRRGFGLE